MQKGYNKIQITEEELRTRYVTQLETAESIAASLGVSSWWVGQRLRKYKIPIRGAGTKFMIPMDGNRFGHYTVVKLCDMYDKSKGARWLCRCDCGSYSEVQGALLRRGEATSCGKCKHSVHWKGVGELSGQYFCALRGGAKTRKLEFDVTKEDLWNLFEKQDRKCAVTGVSLVFVKSYGDDSSLQTASLDRIDNDRGYHIDNVRWVHKAVNAMRWHMTDKELVYWCCKVAEGPVAKTFASVVKRQPRNS